ncbi:MAG: DUF2892 domain-containing protein [candidate division Zixibacteria bacterium]|nr:DUF2892 domain-containing protein [candidate division Zixibacteria bacterium]
MGPAKNVGQGEKVARLILGVVLIPLAFFLTGFWKPLFIVVGVFFLLTALVGY